MCDHVSALTITSQEPHLTEVLAKCLETAEPHPNNGVGLACRTPRFMLHWRERERERESAFDNYFAIMEVNAVLSIIIVTYKVNSHSPSKLGITISYILTIKTKYTTFI